MEKQSKRYKQLVLKEEDMEKIKEIARKNGVKPQWIIAAMFIEYAEKEAKKKGGKYPSSQYGKDFW